MSPQADRIAEEALQLPVPVRAQLAKQLIDSLTPAADSAVADAWWEVVERRLADAEAGRAKCIPAVEAMRQARERLR